MAILASHEIPTDYQTMNQCWYDINPILVHDVMLEQSRGRPVFISAKCSSL